MRKLMVLFFALACTHFTGCLSDPDFLEINTSPIKAPVSCDGATLGMSPVKTEIFFEKNDLGFWSPRKIQAHAEGYESEVISLSKFEYEDKYQKMPLTITLHPLHATVSYQITSNPSGATVYHNGKNIGATPLQVPLALTRGGRNAPWTVDANFVLKKDTFETVSWVLQPGALDPGKKNGHHSDLVQIEKTFVIEIVSKPAGAKLLENGKVIGITPCTIKKTFIRSGSNSRWDSRAFDLVMDNFFSKNFILDGNDINDNSRVSVNLEPKVLQKTITLNCNLGGAEVWVNDQKTTMKTPCRYMVVLHRNSPEQAFSKVKLAAGMGRYQHKNGQDRDVKVIDALLLRKIDKVDFNLEKKLWQDMKIVVYQNSEQRFRTEEVRAYLWDIEKEPQVKSVTKVTNYAPKDMVASRIATFERDGEAYILYSVPEIKASNMNLWAKKVRGAAAMRLTQGKFVDETPCVTPDGSKILFSSNRLGNDFLWRFNVTGRGGFTKITDSDAADSWPTILGTGRICYTSRLKGSSSPQIWSCNFDGTLPTQLREGEAPAVSPDGKKIAFIAADPITNRKKLWIMDADGGNPTQITTNAFSDEQCPCWMPDGKHIVYASNQAVVDGKNNYDIWIINIDGVGQTQLTVNGSDDRFPVVDKEGKYVYFYSNRGMTQDYCTEIWRLELNMQTTK